MTEDEIKEILEEYNQIIKITDNSSISLSALVLKKGMEKIAKQLERIESIMDLESKRNN